MDLQQESHLQSTQQASAPPVRRNAKRHCIIISMAAILAIDDSIFS